MALSDNIKAAYNLSDTSDASGNGNTLTNTGSVAFSTPSKIGNAAQFTGSMSKRLGVSNALGWNVNNGYTWNLWVYNSSFTAGYFLDTETTAGSNRRIICHTSAANTIQVLFGLNAVTSGALSASTWYMLTVTSNAGNGEFFINGSSIGTAVISAGLTASLDFFSLGNSGTSLTSELNGSIDIAHTFDRVLSGSEITTLFDGGVGLEFPYPVSGTGACKSLLGVGR